MTHLNMYIEQFKGRSIVDVEKGIYKKDANGHLVIILKMPIEVDEL